MRMPPQLDAGSEILVRPFLGFREIMVNDFLVIISSSGPSVSLNDEVYG